MPTRPGWKALLATTRPISSIEVGALSASAAISGQGRITIRAIAAGLAMMAMAMFGFAVNDAFDYSRDRAAGVTRPIASGELSRGDAVRLACGLLMVALGLALVVGTGGAAFAATAVLLVAYSPVAARLPLCKNVYVAAICCAPLYYGALAGGKSCPGLSYAALASFVLGREMLMDADEMQGYARAGMRTPAVILGHRAASLAGHALMLAASVALVALVRGAVALTSASAALVSLVWVLAWPGMGESRRIELSRLPMLLGSVALAFAHSWRR